MGSSVTAKRRDNMLPYKSVQEAEAAMAAAAAAAAGGGEAGRALTAAEMLWFRYTAAVPDAYLFALNLLFVFLIFHVFSIPALLLDLLAGPSGAVPSLRRFKLQPNSFLDAASLLRCYAGVMRLYTCVVLPLMLFSTPVFKFVGIRTSLPLPSMWEILAQLIVYSVIEDYLSYWNHRLLHTKWGYNNIHFKHHEFSSVTSICGPYVDWREMLFSSLPAFLGPAIVPGHIVTLWLWFALRQLVVLEGHSGYDFPWAPTKLIPFLVTSDYHDHHHLVGEKSQGNFAAVFTYCDYIYGTDKGYGYKKRLEAAKKKH